MNQLFYVMNLLVQLSNVYAEICIYGKTDQNQKMSQSRVGFLRCTSFTTCVRVLYWIKTLLDIMKK